MSEGLIPVAQQVWRTKYRFHDGAVADDRRIEDTWRRVARALAAIEPHDRQLWADRFYNILEGFKFLPGGRILAGAGTGRQVTLLNCFVMGVVDDSLERIFEHLKEAAVTMQQGGGVGYDFSALRPRGTHAKGVGMIASGPVSFMEIWDAMCSTLLSTGARRGAMMATLRCDHPDIETFITAKQKPGKLRNFNLSIQVTDAFMEAVRRDEAIELVFPAAQLEDHGETVSRHWPGYSGAVPGRVFRRMSARLLWQKIMRAAYDYSEPGVLFVDRINRLNNLWYCEHLSATNPCGEIPLPPYGACDLGSINLTRFVRQPFDTNAQINLPLLRSTVEIATRLLDNVIDASLFPLERQLTKAKGTRRIGLGITGLADALIMLDLHYGEPKSVDVARRLMREICYTAYRTSVALAREKGPFPLFDRDKYLASEFVGTLPDDIRAGIAEHGIRNSHLVAIAPAGSISLLANNISSGLEPVFAFRQRRRILEENGASCEHELEDAVWRRWQAEHRQDAVVPASFVTAHQLPPEAHLAMQAALQPLVDNAVSKTINVPETYPFDEFQSIYAAAYDRDLKGCTTFRPNEVTGAILSEAGDSTELPHCCAPEREAD